MAEGVEKATNKHSFVSENFTKYIAEQYVVNSNGDTITGVIAFNVDMKVEMAKPLEQRNLPVYKAKLEDGSVKYIIPLRGRGLWGPIWGYIALNDDLNTITVLLLPIRAKPLGWVLRFPPLNSSSSLRENQFFRATAF